MTNEDLRALLDLYYDEIVAHIGYLTAFSLGLFSIFSIFHQIKNLGGRIVLFLDMFWILFLVFYVYCRLVFYIKAGWVTKEALGLVKVKGYRLFCSKSHHYTKIQEEVYKRATDKNYCAHFDWTYRLVIRFSRFVQNIFKYVLVLSLVLSLILFVCTMFVIWVEDYIIIPGTQIALDSTIMAWLSSLSLAFFVSTMIAARFVLYLIGKRKPTRVCRSGRTSG